MNGLHGTGALDQELTTVSWIYQDEIVSNLMLALDQDEDLMFQNNLSQFLQG